MNIDEEKLRIGEAAKFLGVTVQTLRNWEKTGKLSSHKSGGRHRYYFKSELRRFMLDLPELGLSWAKSAQAPDLPDEFYCERQDRFTSRLEKMSTLLLQSDTVSEEMTSLLVTVAGEIGDNSFMHNIGNWPDVAGVFFAHDIGKRFIVLADRGQGVRKTLSRVRPDIETDIEALRIAFTEIVSGRQPEKRGNGLKVVKHIVESKPIGLVFRSGIAGVNGPKPSGPMKFKMEIENIQGTYAIIIF